MTKRARYQGGFPITIFDSEASVYAPPIVAELKPGQMLPTETDQGDPMPARIRDELLAREDWSEVSQSDQTKPKEDS